MNTTTEYLNDIAIKYHLNTDINDKHIEDICQKNFIEWLLGKINLSQDIVLELGYGDGVVTKALASENCQLTLLEGADYLYRQACALYPDIQCIHGLFEEYSAEHEYDVILASHVLEHLDDPVSLLRKMARWIKNDGTLIIIVPNKLSIHRRLSVLMQIQSALDDLSSRDMLVGHRRVYCFDTLESDLVKANFKIVERTGFFLKVLPNSMMLQYSHELLQALNDISCQIPPDFLANIAVIAKLDIIYND